MTLPLRILGMVASPDGAVPLDVDREKALLEEALGPLRERKQVELVWLEGQTWRDLQQALQSGPWHIFHYIGHAGFDEQAGVGALMIADDQQEPRLLQATELDRLLDDHASLRLVVLNACEGARGDENSCFSSTAAILARGGVAAVLAMQAVITDEGAIEFARSFYGAMSAGFPVDAAVCEARKAMSLKQPGSTEWSVPVLLMRADDGYLWHLDAPAEPDGKDREIPFHAVATAKNRLPVPLTTFVGREQEIAQITALLAKTRLLTLTGPGGCGKTRLAYEVAGKLAASFPNGVWLAELAALVEPASVPQEVAAVLGIREEPMQPLLTTLTAYLQDKHLLLILDNCEHLAAACAALAEALLSEVPKLWLLVTSRVILNIEGEAILNVPPLALPEDRPEDRSSTLPARLAEFPAVSLFLDRAQATQADFKLTVQNAGAVAQICRQLDGLPLAIELAAPCLNFLGVEEIAARLGDRFELLSEGRGTKMPHHRTLRAMVDWSYELLKGAERSLFNILSVFSGSFALEAAVAVAGTTRIDEYEVIEVLWSLVRQSLVQAEKVTDGTARYRMLETLRQYGQQRLKNTRVNEKVHEGHFLYYLALVEQGEPELRGSHQVQWLDQLRTEQDNLRAALAWGDRMASGDAASGEVWMAQSLRLTGALCGFWELQGHLEEGRRWTESMLALPGAGSPTAQRAKVLSGAGSLAEEQGDYSAARGFYEESLGIWRHLDDRAGIAKTLKDLGNISGHQGDDAGAQSLYAESQLVYRELGDLWGISATAVNLGILAQNRNDYPAAAAYYSESLASFRQLGDLWATAIALNNLGLVRMKQGDYAAAQALLEESIAIARELEDQQGIAYSLQNLGELAFRQGAYPLSRQLYAESLTIRARTDDQEGIATSIESLALLAMAGGEAVKAVHLFGAAVVLRLGINAPVPSDEEAEHAGHLTALQTALGAIQYETAWRRGQSMKWREAVELALAEKTPSCS